MAFRTLMESHQQYAYAVGYRLLHDEEDTKDVVQETFVRIWRNLANYRTGTKFTTWMYKIVINLCYDRMKMEGRRRNILEYLGDRFRSDDPPDASNLHVQIENADLRDQIIRAARGLPPKERLVFQLRDLEDFTVQEIADLADMSIASVKTNLCYARRRIRTALSGLQEARS